MVRLLGIPVVPGAQARGQRPGVCRAAPGPPLRLRPGSAGFCVKDSQAWRRGKAPHRAQRLSLIYDRRGQQETSAQWQGWRVGNLRPTYEPILWFIKPYRLGATIADNVLQHGVGAYCQDGFLSYTNTPDNVLQVSLPTAEAGLHPTRKPLRLLQALIALTVCEGQLVLDPLVAPPWWRPKAWPAVTWGLKPRSNMWQFAGGGWGVKFRLASILYTRIEKNSS